jgi:hypothetical protein
MTSVHGSCGHYININTTTDTIQTQWTSFTAWYSTRCLPRLIYNTVAQITSIWYETSQGVKLSQGRNHTHIRHSSTLHSVVNAVECSRQRLVAITRTDRSEVAGSASSTAAIHHKDHNAGIMRTGQDIWQWGEPLLTMLQHGHIINSECSTNFPKNIIRVAKYKGWTFSLSGISI